jgi:hypothetical protein
LKTSARFPPWLQIGVQPIAKHSFHSVGNIGPQDCINGINGAKGVKGKAKRQELLDILFPNCCCRSKVLLLGTYVQRVCGIDCVDA